MQSYRWTLRSLIFHKIVYDIVFIDDNLPYGIQFNDTLDAVYEKLQNGIGISDNDIEYDAEK